VVRIGYAIPMSNAPELGGHEELKDPSLSECPPNSGTFDRTKSNLNFPQVVVLQIWSCATAYDLLWWYFISKTNTNKIQRRRCIHLEIPTRRHRSRASLATQLRRQQPKHYPCLLYAPQDPRHSTQRPRNRPLRCPHRLLRLYLLRPTHLSSNALLLPRTRS